MKGLNRAAQASIGATKTLYGLLILLKTLEDRLVRMATEVSATIF